jgi:pimeloyl-ACP methyl ester carboxylesterase
MMELHFASQGEGSPFIILHGLFGSLENWTTMARRFAENFRVFAVDQRNHGRSPHAAEMSYPIMAEDLSEFMERQHLASAAVLGHSMGGKTAMQLALSHPEKISKLVVVDIAPKAYPPHHRLIIDALLALDLTAFDDRRKIEAALAGSIPDLAVRQFLLKNLKRDSTGVFRWQLGLQDIKKNYNNLNEGLREDRPFNNPSLFLRGEHSDYVQPTDFPVIQRLFPRAKIETIPGTDHWLHAEAPEAFFRIVQEFLLRSKTSG